MNVVRAGLEPLTLNQLRDHCTEHMPDRVWQAVEKYFQQHPTQFYLQQLDSLEQGFEPGRITKTGIYLLKTADRIGIMLAKIESFKSTRANWHAEIVPGPDEIQIKTQAEFNSVSREKESLTLFKYSQKWALDNYSLVYEQIWDAESLKIMKDYQVEYSARSLEQAFVTHDTSVEPTEEQSQWGFDLIREVNQKLRALKAEQDSLLK